jgi:MOSC domain-containing protein YiiM
MDGARLISLNVGRAEPHWTLRGQPVSTGIYKRPVDGGVMARKMNLDGDEQADRRVHGGLLKAVYAYPSEHYGFWAQQLGDVELGWGAFGENLTTSGLSEADVRIGDEFTLGGARLRVTQPRYPCFKLATKMRRREFPLEFLDSGRTGFYLSVVTEGVIAAGDRIERVSGPDGDGVSVLDLVRLATGASEDRDLIRRALDVPGLPNFWREQILDRHRS